MRDCRLNAIEGRCQLITRDLMRFPSEGFKTLVPGWCVNVLVIAEREREREREKKCEAGVR